MKRPAVKITAIVLAVIVAVLLAFHFTAVAVLISEYDGEITGFQAFLRAESELTEYKLSEIFAKIRYRFTGSVSYNDVVSGGGYLFPTDKEPFDYVADAEGALDFSDEEKKAILEQLLMRKEAHKLDITEYFVFVIPNSQSVLKDDVPFGDPDAVTRAQKLGDYLHKNGFDNYFILDTALTGTEYEPFHNTDNAINEYGAFLSFEYIVSKLPEQLGRRMNRLDPGEINVGYSDGRGLAKKAALQRVIKNKNVYYDTSVFESMYGTETRSGLTFSTLLDEYNDFLGESCVIVESYDKYELNLFRPLFGAAFSEVCFKEDLSYSSKAAGLISPSAVVCLIREDRLSALLEEYDARTYKAKLGDEEEPEITDTPDGIVAVPFTPRTALIAGKCEDNCEIKIEDGDETYTVKSACGRFFAEVPAEIKEKTVRITAEAIGKTPSKPVAVSVRTVPGASSETDVGGTSMLYYTPTLRDYTGGNLYSDRRLSYIKDGFVSYISDIRAITGKNTKVIFLVAPDPLSVYPDAASDKYKDKRAEYTRLDQVSEALSGVDGLVFLDLRTQMRQNTDLGKLFYQTDTHWTELGAYFGYRAVISAVSEDFDKVAPLPLNAFELTEKTVAAGDLSAFAGLSGFTERVGFLTPTFKYKAVGVPEKPDTIDRSVYAEAFTSVTGNRAYPNAVVVRDSYSANLFPMICEHFNIMYCQPMWDPGTDEAKLAELKADYVIVVCSERNLDSYVR